MNGSITAILPDSAYVRLEEALLLSRAWLELTTPQTVLWALLRRMAGHRTWARANDRDEKTPENADLALLVGCSVRQVRRHLADLESSGFLVRRYQTKDGRSWSKEEDRPIGPGSKQVRTDLVVQWPDEVTRMHKELVRLTVLEDKSIYTARLEVARMRERERPKEGGHTMSGSGRTHHVRPSPDTPCPPSKETTETLETVPLESPSELDGPDHPHERQDDLPLPADRRGRFSEDQVAFFDEIIRETLRVAPEFDILNKSLRGDVDMVKRAREMLGRASTSRSGEFSGSSRYSGSMRKSWMAGSLREAARRIQDERAKQASPAAL